MMLSMYSAVSGMKNQQTKLNVIANNISNVNTAGYKQQNVSFSDILSQTLSAAQGASTTTSQGGVNAKQIGLGVTVSSIDTSMATGSTQSTGNATDLSISGSGFFIVKGGSTGDYQFTRAGNFGVDSSGNLTVGGNLVCGWVDYGGAAQADGSYVYDTQKTVEPINIFSDVYNGNKKIIPPQATTAVTVSGSLSPAATSTDAATITTMQVYDAQGNSYDVQVQYTKDATDPTVWNWTVVPTDTATGTISGSGSIQFDTSGKIVSGSTTYPTAADITFTPADTSRAAFTFNLDLSGISSYTSTTTSGVTVSKIDGYESGELQDFSIGSDGVITGVYSNGQSQALGMIALANFTNPAGLEKIGNNLYIATANSGKFTGGVVAGTGGTGALSAGTLEMSNVDLAGQFSEMMITQRAYQANSKVISASDEILQTLIGMVK